VQDLLQQTLGPNARLCFSLAEDLPLALADRNQLEVALLNLVINARDAMPNGGGVITIETSRATLSADELAGAAEAEAGPFVRLSVRDTGTGIPRAALARIFEPFFTTKPAGTGTGLGLSMVYGFVRQSNGHVRVDSREGEGTTFDLFLPLAPADAAAAPALVATPLLEPIPVGKRSAK
jgi:signal transduction histidine kinase